MKISTYRKVLIAAQVVMLIVMFNEDKWLPLIFPSTELVKITTSNFSSWLALLFVPAVLLIFDRFFRFNGHKNLTKLGNIFFTGILVLTLAIPLAFAPARTEITGKSVTKHNMLGSVNKMYDFKDATQVEATVYLSRSSRFSTHLSKNFSYQVTFEDGYTVLFTEFDLEDNWEIVKQIDDTVKSNNIKKLIVGKGIIDSSGVFSTDEYITDKVEMLME